MDNSINSLFWKKAATCSDSAGGVSCTGILTARILPHKEAASCSPALQRSRSNCSSGFRAGGGSGMSIGRMIPDQFQAIRSALARFATEKTRTMIDCPRLTFSCFSGRSPTFRFITGNWLATYPM